MNVKEQLQNIKDILRYDQETGDFWWLEAKKGRDLLKPAGTESNKGYRTISINGKAYLAHRLAYFYMTGEWPPEYIDHINGNVRDNSWENLRAVSAQQNSWNKKRKYNSYTGIKGVRKLLFSDMWEVNIWIEDVFHSEGPFKTYQEACKRYDEIAFKQRGEYHKPEPPRKQRASFKEEDVERALQDFLRKKETSE